MSSFLFLPRDSRPDATGFRWELDGRQSFDGQFSDFIVHEVEDAYGYHEVIECKGSVAA